MVKMLGPEHGQSMARAWMDFHGQEGVQSSGPQEQILAGHWREAAWLRVVVARTRESVA